MRMAWRGRAALDAHGMDGEGCLGCAWHGGGGLPWMRMAWTGRAALDAHGMDREGCLGCAWHGRGGLPWMRMAWRGRAALDAHGMEGEGCLGCAWHGGGGLPTADYYMSIKPSSLIRDISTRPRAVRKKNNKFLKKNFCNATRYIGRACLLIIPQGNYSGSEFTE